MHFWTPKEIRDYVKEHPEITTRQELQKNNPKCYSAAKRKKMLSELFGESNVQHWTPDEIREYLRKHPEITTRKQLKENNMSCFVAASRKHLLVELFGELPFKYSWKTKKMF